MGLFWRQARGVAWGLIVSLAILSFAGLGGCDGPPARSKHWRHASVPPLETPSNDHDGGALPTGVSTSRVTGLRVRLEVDPTHLNPLVEPDEGSLQVAENTIFEPLLRHAPSPSGGPGSLEPVLAESFRVMPSGLELRFRLRDRVTFHDGRPFSAVDAQFSLDEARSSHAPSTRLANLLADVASVELWGPRDLRITLRRPSAGVVRALAEVPMLPAHAYGLGDLARNPRNRAPIGTGPFKFHRWEKGVEIVLQRNDSYWGKQPSAEELVFLIEPDAAQALLRAKKGEIDLVPSLIREHYPEQLSTPGLVESFSPIRLRPPRFRYVLVNARRPPMDDVRVRRAAALLMDRTRIARDAYHGLARPIAGPAWPGGPGDGPSPEPPAFDPSAAARLLDEAGWRDGDKDGVRERGREKLRIVFLVASDARTDAEREVVVGGLRKAGFLVEVRQGERAFLMNRLRAGDFDAAVMEFRGRVDDDLSPLVATGGSLNLGGFSSPTVDAACAALDRTWEPEARASRVAELARLLVTEMPFIPLVAPDPVGLVQRRVKGLVVSDGWFSAADVTLEPLR
ncbi:MAG: peptide ABC transporter substrate-binding protein [Deltaproteobacteria bacterium]|nr:peptide ABC transporter substrate-binding protein [Deltaproteobacteria bacterium]